MPERFDETIEGELGGGAESTPDAAPLRLKQFLITCSMGKRLIGKAMAVHPAVRSALARGFLVIVAGTTNGYVAEEVLKLRGQGEGFSRKGFRRGAVAPPGVAMPKADFPGDVVLVDGVWARGKQIFDVVNEMKAGDVILKGGNAVDVRRGHAAVYVGHPMGGTAGAALPAVVGRCVTLIVPIGLEKRVSGDVQDLAAAVNAPNAEGPRMMVLPGAAFTELDAIALLTGASACLLAGGGIYGAEGAVWIGVKGDARQLGAAESVIAAIADEPPCQA